MTAEAKSNVQAAVDAGLLRDALAPINVEPGARFDRIAPSGWMRTITDAEDMLDHPRRAHGTVVARTAAGFTTAVLARSGAEPVTIYSDEQTGELVAVLNDDTNDEAGWRDHRVTLGVRKTPEWRWWTEHQGQLSQTVFAEAIEGGLDEIVAPTPADMLRIAETFEAQIDVKFAQGEQLRNGARQLTFEEKINAKAGGSLEIPEVMKLAVAPYIGGPKYEIEARVKFRIREQKLTIGYSLVRPWEVEAAAFRDTVAKVAENLDGVIRVEGVAPAPRS